LNPLLEVWLIVARELRKNLRSVKGLVMLVLSVLGAVASVMRQPSFEDLLRRAESMGPEAFHDAKAQVIGSLYRDEKIGERLADAPTRLIIFFFIAVWLTPLFVAVVGFDGISSDLQHRSVRYWTIRTRRAAYYVGKYLGLWAAVGGMTLVMHVIVWAVMIARVDASASDTLTWGARFWLTSLPITGAWCAVATLIGSFCRAPMVSLLLTFAAFFVMFFVGFVVTNAYAGVHAAQAAQEAAAGVAHAASEDSKAMLFVRFLYPNSLDTWLLSKDLERVLAGLGVVLFYATSTCLAGSFAFAKRDV
jgi:ABC-type transport system involved in multi-copper enzyme maturation permease subunit